MSTILTALAIMWMRRPASAWRHTNGALIALAARRYAQRNNIGTLMPNSVGSTVPSLTTRLPRTTKDRLSASVSPHSSSATYPVLVNSDALKHNSGIMSTANAGWTVPCLSTPSLTKMQAAAHASRVGSGFPTRRSVSMRVPHSFSGTNNRDNAK